MSKDEMPFFVGEDTKPPQVRPELVAMATETRSGCPTTDEEKRQAALIDKLNKATEKALVENKTPEESFTKLVASVTGVPVERIRELQDLPPVPPLAELTGDRDIDQMLRDCIDTMATKGKEYTVGSKDRLANFRGVAEDVGIRMEQAWYVFFNKHLRAVQSYLKNGCQVQSNEPIQGRIMDCIVYLLLFSKMAKEIEAKRYAAQQLEAGNCA